MDRFVVWCASIPYFYSPVHFANSIHDQEELAAIELQIREFGQTPRRLFVLPHPSRINVKDKKAVVVDEEVRTVGATTAGLSHMDSNSNSWPLVSSTSLSLQEEEEEWVHVKLPGEKTGKGSMLCCFWWRNIKVG